MNDINATESSTTNELGKTIYDGLSGSYAELWNQIGKNAASVEDAARSMAQHMGKGPGFAGDILDLTSGLTSDNPYYELPKEFTGVLGGLVGGMTGGLLGLIEDGPIGAIIGAGLGNILGENLAEEAFEALYKYTSEFEPAFKSLPSYDDLKNFNPNDPNNFDPNDGNNLNPPSNDNNTNAPDSGNNNDEDNAPEPIKPPPPRDPLVLDTNKDGFISTIALKDSNAYFDITGDGIKERVSWIAANDGILVYDKNESGKIDGIDEVFGNFTKNGFEELRELIDSNHDGKIDRQDELFNRLQIWNDLNGDGTTQTNELQSLKDAGVKSIDLNYVTTNITLGGATLTEASKYTDAQNNKELVADVNLEYNPILTTVDTSTIPDYSVDPDTLFLPQLRGYGLIMDSLISYNTNDALKEKAFELQAGGIQAIAEGFEEFSDMWSGYTELIDSMKEKYNVVGDVNLAEIDKRVWILERLTNSPTQTPTIEARLEALLKAHANETLSEALITQSVIPSYQDGLWHVAVNNRDFKLEMEVA